MRINWLKIRYSIVKRNILTWHYFIRNRHERGELAVELIFSHDQLADGLTKALPKSRFEILLQLAFIGHD